MTEYELIDAAASYFALATGALMIYFSVLTAYLVAAHFAGPGMSRVQVLIVTGLYLTMQLFTTWGTVLWFSSARTLVVMAEGGNLQPIKPS